jgi:hypothetical protein
VRTASIEGLKDMQFNPWWRRGLISDLPEWKRGAFHELMSWIENPPVHQAIMLSGPRQVGKTTLLLQAIQKLVDAGIPPLNILLVRSCRISTKKYINLTFLMISRVFSLHENLVPNPFCKLCSFFEKEEI